MPIRSGAMQRPRGWRCGNTLRQRYDEVGLPCSSTMGSPSPTSTYAISLPRTRCRCFWYGNAAEILFASSVDFSEKAFILRPYFLRDAVEYHSRRGSLLSLRQFPRRVSRLRNDPYRGSGPLRPANLFETPRRPQEQRTDHCCPKSPAMAASTYESIPE